MAFLIRVGVVLTAFSSLGCQLSYYIHCAYHQSKLFGARMPIEKALNSNTLTEEEKRKLKLAVEAKRFAEDKLGLTKSGNYTTFVKLDRSHVSYIVQAAFPWEMKAYQWHFPFVGKVPYKGYFRRELAEEEALELKQKQFDTYVRGVSAYSTLGWFNDSVLSSMLRYEDHDLVELIIHETVHATLFIKSAAEFNERMATFLGKVGRTMFYLERAGQAAPELKAAEADTYDAKLFSDFFTKEIESLKSWYVENKLTVNDDTKAARLKEIQGRFDKDVRPKLKSENYAEFSKRPLNNAILMAYKTYEYALDDFERLHQRLGNDFAKTLAYLKTLEKEKKPDDKLKAFLASPL